MGVLKFLKRIRFVFAVWGVSALTALSAQSAGFQGNGFYFEIRGDQKKLVYVLEKPDSMIALVYENKTRWIDAGDLNDYQLSFIGKTQINAAEVIGIDSDLFSKTSYISHRGSFKNKPRNRYALYAANTHGAVEDALSEGYSGFEIDVRITKDKQIVVSHDDKLKVSTTCEGLISETNYEDLKNCEVTHSPFFPEKKIFRSRATLFQSIPLLTDTLNHYLQDPRVEKIVVDIKRDQKDEILGAMEQLVESLTDEQREKVIFVVSSISLKKNGEIKNRAGQKQKIGSMYYVVETPKGWEPIEDNTTIDEGAAGLSVGVSLGLGLAGKGFAKKIKSVWRVTRAIPQILFFGFKNFWSGHSLDIDAIGWSKRNLKKFKKLVQESKRENLIILAWTVNKPKKIKWLRDEVPEIDFVLSDLSYDAILKIQLKELNQHITVQ